MDVEGQGRREGYRQVWTVYPKVARYRDGRGQGGRNKANPQSCTTAPKGTRMTSSARPAGPAPDPPLPTSGLQPASQPCPTPHIPASRRPGPTGTGSWSSVPQLTSPQPPPAQYSCRPARAPPSLGSVPPQTPPPPPSLASRYQHCCLRCPYIHSPIT